jgi:hypothetical protein
MPQSGDTYSSGSFPQFDHSSLADAHANWKEWKPLMQSAMHSTVLSHIERQESSKRNYYIISPGVIIKAIIII